MFLSSKAELKGEVDVLFLEAVGEEKERDGDLWGAIDCYCRANLLFGKHYFKNRKGQCRELVDHIRSIRMRINKELMDYNVKIGRFSADWGERYKEYQRTGRMPPRTSSG